MGPEKLGRLRRSRLVVFAVTAAVGCAIEYLFARPTTLVDGLAIVSTAAAVAFLVGQKP
jgi:hypothetical protein